MITRLPMMPLRDIVFFPHMIAPLVVGRKRSVRALEEAMNSYDHRIMLVTQKDPAVDDPDLDAVYHVGTVGRVMQLLKLPDSTIKVLVEGHSRAGISKVVEDGEFFLVEAEDMPLSRISAAECEAYMREIAQELEKYASLNDRIPKEVVASLTAIEEPDKFAYSVCAHMPLKSQDKQNILEAHDQGSMFELLLSIMSREVEIANIEGRIRSRVKEKIEKSQKDFYLAEKMKAIQKEMGGDAEAMSDLEELEAAIKAKNLPPEARERAEKELGKLRLMPPMSAEATVVRNYIDVILSLPWLEKSEVEIDIDRAEKILDEDHYGLKRPKERILEYLAVQAQVDKVRGPILCLVGPPGVGKTSVCKSVARAMGREFVRLSLGGVRDEAEIRGHRRTYIGAMPGKLIQSLQRVKVNNPVFCLDEVDKMSTDFRGDPASALLEVLDPEQNNAFNDHYLDLDYDLSDIFFITTANNLAAIPPPLRDRMEIINLNGYTEEDKLQIASGFLVPKQLDANGFASGDITFATAAVTEIIRRYTREAGVRNLEREIAAICRKIARKRLKSGDRSRRYRITAGSVSRFLGVPRYRYGLAEEADEIGMATGLAWTEVGGDMLQIETVLMPGKGKLLITGKLGDVMQESAQAALSYIRSRSLCLGFAPDFYQKLDIHVHVPEGAIPKDGPSAGITMATSMVSALLQRPVRRDIAMTGEITLRGRVLPVGGLTEKLLAARRGNISKVLIPKENQRDLEEIPARILRSLEIEFVETVDQVWRRAIVMPEGEDLFRDIPVGTFCAEMADSGLNPPH